MKDFIAYETGPGCYQIYLKANHDVNDTTYINHSPLTIYKSLEAANLAIQKLSAQKPEVE